MMMLSPFYRKNIGGYNIYQQWWWSLSAAIAASFNKHAGEGAGKAEAF